MTRDDIDTLWNQAIDQSIAAGEKFTRYSFVGLLKRQMIRDGWRQCAEGQRTTQFCALAEDAVKAEREACAMLCEQEHGACWHASAMSAVKAAERCAEAIRARSKT